MEGGEASVATASFAVFRSPPLTTSTAALVSESRDDSAALEVPAATATYGAPTRLAASIQITASNPFGRWNATSRPDGKPSPSRSA